MSLIPGQQVDITVEKPAAGGRMLGRHEGQVILVLGAIPGERVRASVDRVEKRLAFATSVEIREASRDRRQVTGDPLCGGCVYSHIEYPRQRALKSEVIADAFARIGRMPLAAAVDVVPSPESGYRLRARLHVRDGRPGFYREGSHQLCDASATGQLRLDAMEAVEKALEALQRAGADAASVELTENLPADNRTLNFELTRGGVPAITAALASPGLTGVTARTDGRRHIAGDPFVSDSLGALTGGRAGAGTLRRGPESFFQNNRYLLPALVGNVLDAVPASGSVLDLYAGVGLFSIALAATGRDRVIAVEGDRASGSDLLDNARDWSDAVQAVVSSVEAYLAGCRRSPAPSLVLDPPRTGVSADAMAAIVRLKPELVVYVSCDPPTMARDARRLADAGYRLRSLQGFDLFPNTPHVETVGVFAA